MESGGGPPLPLVEELRLVDAPEPGQAQLALGVVGQEGLAEEHDRRAKQSSLPADAQPVEKVGGAPADRPGATSTVSISSSSTGSKRSVAAAISWSVCSLTCCPITVPSGFTPITTRPPFPFANAQIV